MILRLLIVSAAVVLPALPVVAQNVTFESIAGALSADDLSPDGRWVVGFRDADGNGFPDGTYRKDLVNDTYTFFFGNNEASAVSDDGQIVIGCMNNPEPGDDAEVAARWTQATGWESLGYLPNAGTCPSRSNGYECNADGSVVVGLSWEGCNGFGFIWTEPTGMLPLENLANGTNRASVISADGTLIGGFAQGSFSRTPCTWTDEGDGTLLDPPNGDALGEVHGMSDDGTILLGEYDEDAFIMSGGELEPVGAGQLLPGWIGIATDIADGGTIVGFDFLPGPGNRRAWIQPDGAGDLQLLSDWAEAHGATIPAGISLEVAQAISTDGSVIVGHSFGTGAWLLRIEFPCDGDTNGDGVVNVNDLNNVILDWGTDGSANGGDITGALPGSPPDGVVNVNDLNSVIVNWGVCE